MAIRSSMQKLIRFLKRDDGPAAVEYAILLALVLVIALAGIKILGDATGGSFENSRDEIDAVLPVGGSGS